MISLLTKNNAAQGYTYLKYSTPQSGKGLGTKVIIFGFKDGALQPVLVIKTVRSERDADVIKTGYENLKRLNALTEGSDFELMFPEALELNEDRNSIWSSETYCQGQSALVDRDTDSILTTYTQFSTFIRNTRAGEIKLDTNYTEQMIRQLTGPAYVIDKLLTYNARLWNNATIILPKILQHGDLTIDNVRMENGKVRIVDCDIFGTIELPGYDVFHFLSKSKIGDKKTQLAEYFKELGIDVVPSEQLMFCYYVHGLMIKRDYILEGRTSAEVIEAFEAQLFS